MALRHGWPTVRGIPHAISALFLLSAAGAPIACSQEATSPQNACSVYTAPLKTTKAVSGQYSEEARREGVEGRVVMCVTVNGEGKVVTAKTISGPPELIQPTIDAVKQWQFEPPTNAPASTTVEMTYSLTKPCPGGGKGMDIGDVKVTVGPGHTVGGETHDALKIVSTVYQPRPPYPEKARAERRRGQLYLSITVNGKGEVEDAKIVMPLDELLDKPALDTVRTWQFKVTPPGGKTTIFPVTLSFHIACLDGPEDR
jgi:periplasmic protein TonB